MREFFVSAFRDPNTKMLSITRASGFGLVVSGIVFAFMHPTEAAMAAALLGGGGFSYFTRERTTP